MRGQTEHMPDQVWIAPWDRFAERYVAVRVAAGTVFVAWIAWGVVGYPETIDIALAKIGGLVFVLSSLGAIAGARYTRIPITTVLVMAGTFDMIAFGVVGVAFDRYPEPVYPALLVLSLFHATVFRRREATLLGLAAGAVYLLTYAWRGRDATLFVYAIAVFKASLLALSSVLLADLRSRLLVHEETIKRKGEREERLNERMQERLDDLQAVWKTTEVIHSSLDLDAVGPHVLELLSESIGVRGCSIFVTDRTSGQTLFSAERGLGRRAATGGSDAAHSVRSFAGEHLACQPVVDHKNMTVVFCAEPPALERLSDEDRRVLRAIARELAVGVENARMYALTRRMAVTDELTGLFNYRYLQQRLDEEVERVRRYGEAFSLIMIDADDFKRYNDTNGHIAGDLALKELGQVLKANVREVDVVCRYGGEEFSVVLPQTDAAGGFVAAEKLREAVAAHEFADGEGVRGVRLTVSLGLATYPTHAESRETLLSLADDALYRAKAGGKDRVRAQGASTPAEHDAQDT